MCNRLLWVRLMIQSVYLLTLSIMKERLNENKRFKIALEKKEKAFYLSRGYPVDFIVSIVLL